jgi:hypothetical protein
LGILAAGLGGAANTASAAPISGETFLFERSFQSGMNRVCVYRGTTGERYMTVGQLDMCPATL